MAVPSIPVLLITGSVGVGKTTVARACVPIVEEHGLPGAYIDLATIGHDWPKPPDDPWNEAAMHRNLACMWRNFQAAGAGRERR